jgi:hypothetical protein
VESGRLVADSAERLGLPCRGGLAYNSKVGVIASERSQTMGMLDNEPDVNTVK